MVAGEDWANIAEACARQTLYKMFQLRALVEGLNRTVREERECVAGIIDAELVQIRSVITADL